MPPERQADHHCQEPKRQQSQRARFRHNRIGAQITERWRISVPGPITIREWRRTKRRPNTRVTIRRIAIEPLMHTRRRPCDRRRFACSGKNHLVHSLLLALWLVFRQSTNVKFTCNLGAERCNLGLPLERSRDGDEIILEVVAPHEELAEMVASSLRSHLKTADKQVIVTVQVRPGPAPVLEQERLAMAQRIAQRA